ncbi:hypothetical protein HK102_012031 [Quaeritorhiza haematococci]|nr:hypothetical protein HK102_012031 [Quaeritorhiza haematococci]
MSDLGYGFRDPNPGGDMMAQYPDGYMHVTETKLKPIMMPFIYGFGGVALLGIFIGIYIVDERSKEEEAAWAVWDQEAQKKGLVFK